MKMESGMHTATKSKNVNRSEKRPSKTAVSLSTEMPCSGISGEGV